jgi:hypothetical protein
MNKYRRSSGSSKIIILERHLATGNTPESGDAERQVQISGETNPL